MLDSRWKLSERVCDFRDGATSETTESRLKFYYSGALRMLLGTHKYCLLTGGGMTLEATVNLNLTNLRFINCGLGKGMPMKLLKGPKQTTRAPSKTFIETFKSILRHSSTK